MANGGIIGPVVEPVIGATSELITTFNAPGTFTAQAFQTQRWEAKDEERNEMNYWDPNDKAWKVFI